MTIDFHLRASDEAAMTAALLTAGVTELFGETVRVASGYALDVIGTIYKPTGFFTEVDGMQIPVMAAMEGYHANLRGELTAEQIAALPIIVAPARPVRVWA